MKANIEQGADLLVILQHADGFFPSGSFAFSQGLEAVSLLVDRLGPFDFDAFVKTQIFCRWAPCDRVALARAHRIAGYVDEIAEFDNEVEASILTEGFRTGSRRNGMAFLTAHAMLSSPGASEYRNRVREGFAQGHLPVVQGMIWCALGLDEATAVAMSGYQTIASMSTAAVRLGLIGAIDAQACITRALPAIREASAVPIADDQPLSSFVPLTEIALALHRTNDQRLFSN